MFLFKTVIFKEGSVDVPSGKHTYITNAFTMTVSNILSELIDILLSISSKEYICDD